MNIHWHNENEEKLKINQKHGVTYLTYPALEALPGFVHGFSTRLGGVSEGCFAQMNLSFTRGDREEAVRENYRLLGEAMGFSPEDVVTSDQTHTTHVLAVGEKDRGNGITRPRPYQDVDGLVTNVPGLMLATFYAARDVALHSSGIVIADVMLNHLDEFLLTGKMPAVIAFPF